MTHKPVALATLVFGTALAAAAGDWPDWRGPARAGRSAEHGLPVRWTPGGQGQLWRAPYGGRSAPVVLGERVFVQNAVGEKAERRERVVCLDANTGKLLWEHPFNV